MAQVGDRERLAAVRRSGLLEARHDELDRLTALAGELIGAPVALISLVEADRQVFASQRGLTEPWATRGETPITHSVCRTVVARDEPLVIDDLGAHPDFIAHPARADLSVEAYCGVPIRDDDGHVLGSFCVIDDEQRPWDAGTVELLERLAAVVGDAIRTNNDYRELVSDLQERLIPQNPPALATGRVDARYRPVTDADLVGGDFFDWNTRADGSVDLVLGDAVGHGIHSTQAAAQLRAAARAVFTGSTTSAADVVRRIGRSCRDLPGCDCAAITVARVEADGRTVTWVRAGSLPPLVLGDASARIVDGPVAPPLGTQRASAAHECATVLAPGETILFFTDGLVERRGDSLDAGFERLVAAAALERDLGHLIEAVCPTTLQRDDVAMISWTAG